MKVINIIKTLLEKYDYEAELVVDFVGQDSMGELTDKEWLQTVSKIEGLNQPNLISLNRIVDVANQVKYENEERNNA
jgi:hypothetical protein